MASWQVLCELSRFGNIFRDGLFSDGEQAVRKCENVFNSSQPQIMTHVLMPLLLVYVRSHVRSSSIGVNFLVSEKKLWESLWREISTFFVWKGNLEDLTWNKMAKTDSPKLDQKMWTQLWGRLGPGNIVFCPKWDSVVEFVLLDLEGVCLAPFRPVSQALGKWLGIIAQDSLWLFRCRKILWQAYMWFSSWGAGAFV